MQIAAWRRLRARWAAPEFRTQGLERLTGERWRASDDDPQFIFVSPRNPLVVHVRSQEVSPQVYFDSGAGFSQAQSARFEACDDVLFVFDFAGSGQLCALRLDPFARPGEVDLGFASGAQGEALAREVEAAGAARVVRVRVRDHLRGAKQRARAPQEHFAAACALAKRELDGRYNVAPATPLISLVCPLYDTPPAWLDDLLASFRQQKPGWAELVLSDDGSTSPKTARWLNAHAREPGLTILNGAANRGIAGASNAGIAAARGGWIGFIDHDDALSDHAVAVLARAIDDNPQARFFYTDELIADGRLKPLDFFDKPAFDDVLLSGVNYINHLSLYRRDLIAEVGALREGFDGSQDYDLALRATRRLKRDEIRHVPYPAYIWRRDGRSYSAKFIDKATANARRALGEAYGGEVGPAWLPDLHRVRLVAPRPKVSVIVPNCNAPVLLGQVVEGLYQRTDYVDFELIVVDNGSDDPETLALYEKLGDRPDFKLHREAAAFNFSRQINTGVTLASGTALLLLNNDVEMLEPGWLAEMVECLAYPDVGVVGARLLYPDRTLQHAGVVVGLGGLAGCWYGRRPADFPGPMGRLAVRSTLTAVTGACMLISRACWEATGPFDDTDFAIAYYDVDFCLRAKAVGFRTLYTPFATLVHHESATRGTDTRGPNRARLLEDQARLRDRHGTVDFLDPVMSPWHGRDGSEPARITLERLPPAR